MKNCTEFHHRKSLACYQMLLRHLLFCKHVERLLCNVWISTKVSRIGCTSYGIGHENYMIGLVKYIWLNEIYPWLRELSDMLRDSNSISNFFL